MNRIQLGHRILIYTGVVLVLLFINWVIVLQLTK